MSDRMGADKTDLQFTLALPDVEDIAVIDFTHREAFSQPFELTLNLASRNDSLNRDWPTIEVNHVGEQPQARPLATSFRAFYSTEDK